MRRERQGEEEGKIIIVREAIIDELVEHSLELNDGTMAVAHEPTGR